MPESKDTDRRKEQAMGRIWLCEEETAKRPFLLEEEGRRLYSFEELCYYLYQNTGVLEESFFNEKLCQWLEEELGLAALAGSLRGGIEQERSGCWCMEQILQAGGYYNSAELENALLTAKHMEDKTPLDREKLRGDRLLKAEKYRDAVRNTGRPLHMQARRMGMGTLSGGFGTIWERPTPGRCFLHRRQNAMAWLMKSARKKPAREHGC